MLAGSLRSLAQAGRQSHLSRIASASFHYTAFVAKDKPSGTTKGEPRKSRFLKVDEFGNEIKPEKKQRSTEDEKKLAEERKERELRKKETKLKQIEIQKKRDALKEAKGSKKAAPA